MARGRFISNSVITDRQIHDLSSDTCRLAYTWAITLADREGRVVGEPDLLLAQLFPRRIGEMSPDAIEGFIREWVAAGFVIWYVGSDGDRVLQFVNFEKHQIGLRKERETASDFDAPDDCRIIAGVEPDQNPVNVNVNVKNNENVKLKPARSDFSAFQKVWEQESGHMVTGFTEFTKMCQRFEKEGVTPEIYRTAIQEQQGSDYAVKRPSSVEEWAVRLARSISKKPTKQGESFEEYKARLNLDSELMEVNA